MNKKPLLLIIGNSNVGKTLITKLLLPSPSKFKGKSGKSPGSTLLIRTISQPKLAYKIIDLPGFGYMKRSSKRREEHIKKQIVNHIENHYFEYFLALVVINILRIEDEIIKYFIDNKTTIPLSFELIKFLEEFKIPILLIFNKIDKISNIEKVRLISLFIENAKQYGIDIVDVNNYDKKENINLIPYLEFSALRKINQSKLTGFINQTLSKNK